MSTGTRDLAFVDFIVLAEEVVHDYHRPISSCGERNDWRRLTSWSIMSSVTLSEQTNTFIIGLVLRKFLEPTARRSALTKKGCSMTYQV